MLQAALLLAFKLLPNIIKAVKDAEDAYKGIGQGVLKKAKVLNVISVLLDTMDEFVDGTEEYKAMVLRVVDNLIEAIVGALNISGLWDEQLDMTELEGKVIQL